MSLELIAASTAAHERSLFAALRHASRPLLVCEHLYFSGFLVQAFSHSACFVIFEIQLTFLHPFIPARHSQIPSY